MPREKSVRDPFAVRSSGVLLHPTSLPGPFGCGDLGPEAHRFVDFLAAAGQSWWQMLPVGPLGGGYSPYDSPSSYAGNPALISLELLANDGLLTKGELSPPRALVKARAAEFALALKFKQARLETAYERFKARGRAASKAELTRFVTANQTWLRDYALFQALKAAYPRRSWTQWPAELRSRKRQALKSAERALQDQIHFIYFLQYTFDRQWRALQAHAAKNGVALMGDVPMFVAHDGADVWAHQELFFLDSKGNRTSVAGVPPDYFSKTGQRWGNPLYRWDKLQKSGFSWWVDRLSKTLERFDAVRLDHFIGFHRYWEIPANARTARRGRFVQVPGRAFLKRLRESFGGLPFVAEDLGLVTSEVHQLRDEFGLPGMRVLEFAFGEGSRLYQPHNYPRRSVVYTGTHDNDTLVGWLNAVPPRGDRRAAAAMRAERRRALNYANSTGPTPHWDIIRLALMSVANTAIFPMQDLLGLGSEARMNIPGTPQGNWRFRLQPGQITPGLAEQMWELCELYERLPSR